MKTEEITWLYIGMGNFACRHYGCTKRSDYGINKKGNWEYEKTYCEKHFKIEYPDKKI